MHTSVGGCCREYIFKAKRSNRVDLDVFLAENFKLLYDLLCDLLWKHHHLKFQLAVNVK